MDDTQAPELYSSSKAEEHCVDVALGNNVKFI